MFAPRISASSYSNTAPLVWSFLYGENRGKYELIMDNAPARSAELLRGKRIDAALVPIVEYQRIDDVFLVADVCVGARRQAKSVCLVTKDKDLNRVETVALDVSSRTSIALAKIIFREFYNREPVYRNSAPDIEKMLEDYDCALLIGDPALTLDETKYRKFDLAETWRAFTGCGFVFAMWMANREKIEIVKRIDFAAARDEGLRHLDQIVANYQTEISLDRETFKTYLAENISYSIDREMREGLELFFKFARRHGLIETLKPLNFI